MKSFFTVLLLCGGLAATPVLAQTPAPAPVEFNERVNTDNYSRADLQARALDWVQKEFSFKPTTNLQADAATGTVHVTGTATLKPVNGKDEVQERTARFEFVFKASDQGYTYSVNSFQVVPDPKTPNVLVSLDEYLVELRADKAIERTKNDRRVRAQANAVANDVALSFRSYMNTIPPAGDGEVGRLE